MADTSRARANGETVSSVAGRWPVLVHCPEALAWLRIQADLGLAPRTLEAYSRGLVDYLTVCTREGIEPLSAGRAEVARYVRDLAQRPHPRGATIVSIDSGVGLANATLQQRLVIVRLFYDYLIEEGRRDTNPAGRGRYTPGRAFGGQRERALVSRFTKLPWIPTDAEWQQILAVARQEPMRTRLMLALAYDAGLRREELCRLQTDDLDPAYRTLRVRAETTKTRRARVVPYSEATGVLLQRYLAQRRQLSAARGVLWLSESRRNRTQPITTPVQAPHANAYAERFERSIREESLARLILFRERRLLRALDEFIAHYHGERNHQGLGNELIHAKRPTRP
jgi:integrase/recombinase XerD